MAFAIFCVVGLRNFELRVIRYVAEPLLARNMAVLPRSFGSGDVELVSHAK
jgi:hypothetical protein